MSIKVAAPSPFYLISIYCLYTEIYHCIGYIVGVSRKYVATAGLSTDDAWKFRGQSIFLLLIQEGRKGRAHEVNLLQNYSKDVGGDK